MLRLLSWAPIIHNVVCNNLHVNVTTLKSVVIFVHILIVTMATLMYMYVKLIQVYNLNLRSYSTSILLQYSYQKGKNCNYFSGKMVYKFIFILEASQTKHYWYVSSLFIVHSSFNKTVCFIMFNLPFISIFQITIPFFVILHMIFYTLPYLLQ